MMSTMTDPAAGHEIVLVRHGETEWSSSGQHTSFTDIALTDRGREQACELATRLASRTFSLVLSSPRVRARETCTLAGLGDRFEISDDLAEWDYGEYEGCTTASIRATRPGWTIFTGGVPGGESADDVGARADRVLARAAAVDGDVALFSHAHFLRVLAVRWVGLPVVDGALLALDTATVSVLSYEREQRVIRVWNS
jgi:probable phosphoglycerate mutase